MPRGSLPAGGERPQRPDPGKRRLQRPGQRQGDAAQALRQGQASGQERWQSALRSAQAAQASRQQQEGRAMSKAQKLPLTAADPTKENRPMQKRAATLATILAAATMLLALLPAASASAASPWWQVLDGSRPSNLWIPEPNEQEVEPQLVDFFGLEEAFVAKIEVSGSVVGCLGNSGFVGTVLCEEQVGFPPTTTAAQLEAVLEAAFATSGVDVTGGPVGGEPFHVITSGGAAPTIGLTVLVGSATTKVITPGGSGRLVVTVTNLGDAPVQASEENPVTIKDELPEGVVATGTEAFGGSQGKVGPVECKIEAPDEVLCSFEDELPPYEAIEVEVFASLTGNPPVQGAPGKISVSGGDAPFASSAQTIKVSPEPVPFGIERFSAQAEEEGGALTTQAGRHPFQFTNTLQLNAGAVTPAPTRDESLVEQPALPRNLDFPLPAGLVGNATAMAQCDMATFLAIVNLRNFCSDESAIGVSSVTIIESSKVGFLRLPVPVFNLPPAHGEPARFGFVAAGVPVLIDTSLDPENDYRITASVSNVTQVAEFLSSTTSLWGTPGDPRHDNARGWDCISRVLNPELICERPSNLSEAAFLRQPVNCNSPLVFDLDVEPWNVPIGSQIESASFQGDPLLGCNKVPFDPSISAAPTSKLAEAPSGLSFELSMPNSNLLNKDGIAEGQPKKVEVTLPEGMTVNPSAAEGLAVCSPSDYARERFNSKPGDGCPDASKLGSVLIDTPLIEEQVKGALCQAAPYDNPSNSLLGLYLVARVPERGILVKLDGKVSPDPKTGQLVTIFDDAPQLPFNSFDLSFREGGRAPLVTPPACGDYDIVAKFTPWSAQDPNNPAPSEVITRKSTFTVQRGVDGGACPSGGVPPFGPEFEAGSVNNDAGSYSPFLMHLTRKDGEQDMTRFSAVLPPGVLGNLAGVELCSDAAIAAAKAKSATEELANPSCPQSSLIGRTLAGAGVGSVLTYVPGKIYLGGPVNGNPLSVIAITPAKAGPFDVGTVVVREALNLNPRTAEVEVDGAASDPIPHILAGIPLRLRDLRVYVDRENFTLNPTSCEESSAKATLFGSFLDELSSSDDRPIELRARYQAANCANLGFKPKLKLKLKGGTRRGDHPGLTATYTARRGDANLESLITRLPRSAFLDQAHIRTICTRVQFAADSCPKAAQYGYIKAWTPLLDEPLEGPVYLRSSSHKLPDLVFDLHGLVDVEVATRIDSVRGGIRAQVQEAPDAPLSKVVLKMQGQKKGLIVNSRELCDSVNRAGVQFAGHNGKEASGRPELEAQCGGKRKGKR